MTFNILHHAEITRLQNPPGVRVKLTGIPREHHAYISSALCVPQPASRYPIEIPATFDFREEYPLGQPVNIADDALRARVEEEQAGLAKWRQQQTALKEKYQDWEYGMARNGKA